MIIHNNAIWNVFNLKQFEKKSIILALNGYWRVLVMIKRYSIIALTHDAPQIKGPLPQIFFQDKIKLGLLWWFDSVCWKSAIQISNRD